MGLPTRISALSFQKREFKRSTAKFEVVSLEIHHCSVIQVYKLGIVNRLI